MKELVTPESLGRLRTLKTRLSVDLDVFFNEGDGVKEKWCVYFKNADYRPRFRLNTPPSKEIDYLTQFWAPHRDSIHPTYILYPEPCFFTDGHNTYLRNPEANRPQDHGRFFYLADKERPDEIYHEGLTTTHSYVPSGTVSALLLLMAHFREWDINLIPLPFLPDDKLPDKGNLIVLGSTTSMQAVATLERSLPFYTGLKEVTVAGDQNPLCDSEYKEYGIRMFQKWGTLTRRWYQYPDRIVTVISGHHGRVVEAITGFLTTRSALTELAHSFAGSQTLPEYFQALFLVQMEEKPRGPLPVSTEVKRVTDIGRVFRSAH